MTDTDVAILGAGPYGLAAAAHLRRAGVDVRVMGQPMSFWRGMPVGMLLRSNWTATCIGDHQGPVVPGCVLRRHGRPLRQAGPAGPLHRLRHVGSAAGRAGSGPSAGADAGRGRGRIPPDASMTAPRSPPAGSSSRPASSRSPTARRSRRDCRRNSSRTPGITRTSAGSPGHGCWSWAAARARWNPPPCFRRAAPEAEVVVRQDHLNWLHGGKYQRKLGRLAPLVYAPTDVGPMGLSRLVAVPDLFRRLPRQVPGSARLPVNPPGRRCLAAAAADGTCRSR